MSIGELTVSIIGDMSKLSRVFSQASSEVGRFGNSVSSMGSSLTSKVGGTLATVGKAALVTGAALGTGLAYETYKSVTAFQSFEKAVSNAASVTGLTGQAFNDAKANISAVAQELGQKTTFSSSQAADALYNLASAGVDVSKITSSQLVPVLNLAAGTQYDLAATTENVTSTLSQFGLGFDSAGRVADVFASASGKTQANMEKLGFSMKYVGTISNSLGIDLESTTAALGLLYNAGLDGESAGTGLRGVLASLAKPTKEATSALEALGLTTEQVNPQTHSMAEIFSLLASHGLDANKAFALVGRESAPALLALASNSSGLQQLTQDLKAAGGAAQTMADQQLDTLAGSMDALSGSVENLMINVGQALAPTIRLIADSLNGQIPAIQEWIVGFVNSFIDLADRLKPSVNSIITIGETIFDAFSGIFLTLSGKGSGVSGVADIINGIFNRIAGIVLEVTPVVQNGIIGIIGFFKQLVSGLAPTWTNLQTIASNVLATFQAFFSGISATASGDAAGGISGTINAITSVLSGLSTIVSGALVSIAPTIRGIISGIISTLSELNTKLGPTWENLGLIFDAGSRIISSAVDSVGKSFGSFTNSLTGSSAITTVTDTIANALNSITETIANFAMSLAENGLSDTIESMFNIDLPDIDFSGILKSVTDTLKGIDFTGIWNSLVSAFNTGKDVITGLIKDLSPTWDNLKSSFDSLKKIIKEVAPDIAALFVALAGGGEGAASSTGSILVDIINGISGAVAGLLKFLADNPKVVEFGLAIVGLAAGFIALAPAIAGVIGFLGTVAGAIGSVIGFLTPLIAMIGSEGLGYTIGYLVATAFPGLVGAISFISATVLPALGTAFGIIVNTVIPILIEGLGLLITPIGLVAGAVALLAVAWSQNWGGIRDKAAEIWAWVKVEVNNLHVALFTAYAQIRQAIIDLYTNWNIIWAGIKQTVSNYATLIVATLQLWYNQAQEVYNNVKTAVMNLYNDWNTRWNNILTAIRTAANNIKTTLQGWYNDAQNKFNLVKAAVLALYNDWKTRWDSIIKQLSDTATKIKTTLQNWYNDLVSKFNLVKSAVLGLYNDWKKKWDDVLSYVTTKKTEIVNKVKGIATDVQNLAGYFWNAGAVILNNLKASVTEGFTRVINTAKEKLKTLKSYLPNSPAKAGPFRELPYWGDVIPGPIEDALKATDPLVSKLSNTLGKLRSPLDNLRDPTASINGGLSNISSVTNNSNSSSNVTYEIHMENHLSNDVDMNKFVREFQKIIKLQGQQGGYF